MAAIKRTVITRRTRPFETGQGRRHLQTKLKHLQNSDYSRRKPRDNIGCCESASPPRTVTGHHVVLPAAVVNLIICYERAVPHLHKARTSPSGCCGLPGIASEADVLAWNSARGSGHQHIPTPLLFCSSPCPTYLPTNAGYTARRVCRQANCSLDRYSPQVRPQCTPGHDVPQPCGLSQS
jgi:hypothetical protein